MRFLILLISTCFGVGYVPVFRGTLAAVLSAIICYIFPQSNFKYLLGFSILIISIVIAGMAERLFNKKDDPRIVVDEFCCFWIAVVGHKVSIENFFWILLFYRIFDMLKPVYFHLQRLGGGFGIFVDDILSAILANLCFRILGTKLLDIF